MKLICWFKNGIKDRGIWAKKTNIVLMVDGGMPFMVLVMFVKLLTPASFRINENALKS